MDPAICSKKVELNAQCHTNEKGKFIGHTVGTKGCCWHCLLSAQYIL